MKLLRMFATAGLVIASLGATTAASARDHNDGRHYQNSRDDYRDRGDHRRDDRDGRFNRYARHDNGNHYGWRNKRGHNRCHTEWRHHRQIRVCR